MLTFWKLENDENEKLMVDESKNYYEKITPFKQYLISNELNQENDNNHNECLMGKSRKMNVETFEVQQI